jgi:hypothetical protein
MVRGSVPVRTEAISSSVTGLMARTEPALLLPTSDQRYGAKVEYDPVKNSFVFSSGASGRGDFILEYGNKQGVNEITLGTSTIYNEELLNTFQNNLSQNSTINVKTAKATSEDFTFKIENHTIGNYDQTWIGKTIHRLTGANVLTVYININILIGDDPKYYSALSVLINTLEQTFGNNKKST